MTKASTRFIIGSLLAASVPLSGCSLTPDYRRPDLPVAAQWSTAAQAGERRASDLPWRDFLTDPRLQVLVATALEHNRDLRIAVARVGEARAQLGLAHADRLPGVSLAASRSAALTPGDLSLTGAPMTSQRYDAGLAVTAFELDFWGRAKSLDNAANAAYLATEHARLAFQLSLIANVADAYLTLLEMDERRELTAATLRNREENRTLLALRRDAGLASDLDLLQANGARDALRAELASLERQQAAAENALFLLVGKIPESLPKGRPLAAQGIVADLAAGLPADLLLARPDIAAAEQSLMAAHANIGAARAAFLPKIVLTMGLGTASRALSGLFAGGSRAWNFQPSLGLPLFNAGRTAANEDLAEARKVIAVAEYEKAIQQAFREVADLLAAREKFAIQLNALEAAASNQAQRLTLAEARYQAGISSYLEVLDAQRELYGAQQNIVQTRRTQLATAAQLYKALGGGLAATPTAAPYTPGAP